MSKIIVISIDKLNKSPFSNGATQHIYFMAKLFNNMGWNVMLVYSKSEIPKQTNNYMNLPIITRKQIDEIMKNNIPSKFDLWMCFEWFENGEWFEKVKQHFGCKIIKYQPGNLFELLHENFLKNKELTQLKNLGFKERNTLERIWLSPHYETRAPVYDVLFSTKTVIAPYIWEPTFIDNYIQNRGLKVDYNETQKRLKNECHIAICEPNRDVLKCSFVPLVGCCTAIKNKLIDKVGIYDYTNSLQQSIGSVLKDMDCLNKTYRNKFIYGGRKPLPDLLQNHSIIISHQNDHMLNYIYLEAAYMGFPIIHNSPMCKEIGYYYEADDVDQILEQIKNVKEKHHLNVEEYKQKSRESIQRYSIYNEDVRNGFINLLKDISLN